MDDVNAKRRRWMGVLARTPRATLETALADMGRTPGYALLRRPEIGLAMVRGRAGGNGQRFNLGEMTLTRCSLRLDAGAVGHGYVAGRDKRHAELAALFDALMQAPDHHDRLERELIAPAEAAQQARRRAVEAEVATSKVNFFTMVRGESS
jgi:alpha-D-ribose 1-methylphosphonate 5-triphosphate synthase subunit PhnG